MINVLEMICYKDDQYIALNKAGPSLLDFGFIHSDATYDVIKLINGKLFLFDDHYDRFSLSTEFYDLENKNKDTILEIVNHLAGVNNISSGFVWLISWRGAPTSGNPKDLKSCNKHFVIYIKPYYDFNSHNTANVVLYTRHCRIPDSSFGQQYKNFAWVDLTLAQRYAISQSADTAILVNSENKITEGPGFGVGFVFGDSVHVPNKDVLTSITIKEIERICKEKKIPFHCTEIDALQSLQCNEMFLASTSGGVIPVSSYEGKRFANDNIVRILQDEYRLRQNS